MRRIVPAALLATGLAACTEISSVDRAFVKDSEFVHARDLMRAVECDLAAAYGAIRDAAPAGWRAGAANVTLTMTVTEVRAVGGTVSLVIPVGAGTLTLGTGLTPTATAMREMDVEFQIGPRTDASCTDLPLDGDLGLVPWANELVALSEASKSPPLKANFNTFFQIANDRSLTPKLVASDGDTASLTAKGTRTVKHRLAVTMKVTPRAPARIDRALQREAEIYLNRIAE